MSDHRNLTRFIRSRTTLDHLTEELRERIAARRIQKFTGSLTPHEDKLTPEQREARDSARLRAIERQRRRR
jgi:hypothetical protein